MPVTPASGPCAVVRPAARGDAGSDVLSSIGHRDVGPLPGTRSRTSTTPSARPRPTTTIVGIPRQLGVLELHAGRDAAAVVEQHAQAALLQPCAIRSDSA
jgi:hypothetical protein